MSPVKEIILEAGEVLKDRYYSSFKFSNKEKFDLVSEADVEIEKIVINKLKKIYPKASFFSEEAGEIAGDSELRWILDPIDGTANFIFGIPYFCISLSLEQKGKIIESYIYNPISKELFHSIESDKKSFLNENEIHVSNTNKIENALVAFGFSANFKNINKYYKDWTRLFNNCKKGLGVLSPALNICNVARGRIDCFIDFGSSMEGHAGASLILKNARGMNLNYDLTSWDYKTKGIIATNKTLLSSLIRMGGKIYE